MSNSHPRRNSLATPQARAGRRGGLTTWAGHSREEMLEVSARGGRKTFCALGGFLLGAMGRGLLWGLGAAGIFAITGLVLAGVPYLLGLLSRED